MQRDVFISHEKNDSDVALDVAARLRSHGFTTWCYEEDSLAGSSYLVQIDRAIEAAKSMLVVVSPSSLRSPHVRNEIVRAYESQKRFIPLRRNIAHEVLLEAQDDDDDERRREWRMAFGASVSIAWDDHDPERVVERIVDGLRRLGVLPGAEHVEYVSRAPRAAEQRTDFRASTSTPRHDAPAQTFAQQAASIADDLQLAKRQEGLQRFLRAPYTRVVFALLVAIGGVVASVSRLLAMTSDYQREYFYRYFSGVRLLDIAFYLIAIWMSALLARNAWRIMQGDWSLEQNTVSLLGRLVTIVVLWVGVSLGIAAMFITSRYGEMRTTYLGGVIATAVFAIIPLWFVRWMFRLPDRRMPAGR